MIVWTKIEDGFPNEDKAYDQLLLMIEKYDWKEVVVGRFFEGEFQRYSEKYEEFIMLEQVTKWTYINFD